MPELAISDDIDDAMNKEEPLPGDKPKRRGRPKGSTNRRNSTFVKEFSAELDAMMKMMAMVWSMRDPVCGKVLNETSQLIAQDIAELAATSVKAREYLERTMGLGKIVPLVMHLTPLLITVRDHHLMPRNEDVPDGGPYPVA